MATAETPADAPRRRRGLPAAAPRSHRSCGMSRPAASRRRASTSSDRASQHDEPANACVVSSPVSVDRSTAVPPRHDRRRCRDASRHRAGEPLPRGMSAALWNSPPATDRRRRDDRDVAAATPAATSPCRSPASRRGRRRAAPCPRARRCRRARPRRRRSGRRRCPGSRSASGRLRWNARARRRGTGRHDDVVGAGGDDRLDVERASPSTTSTPSRASSRSYQARWSRICPRLGWRPASRHCPPSSSARLVRASPRGRARRRPAPPPSPAGPPPATSTRRARRSPARSGRRPTRTRGRPTG